MQGVPIGLHGPVVALQVQYLLGLQNTGVMQSLRLRSSFMNAASKLDQTLNRIAAVEAEH
jgi:hypothetical protein